MSGSSMRAIVLSLACVVVLALPADAAGRGGGGHGGGGHAGGGGGGHVGGGGGIARGGGGGGGAHFSAPAFRGGGGASFARPGFSGGRSFGGVRSFGGARTFSRPMISGRSISRGTRFTSSPRLLHGGRAIHGSRFVGRSGVYGRSARIGTRSLAGRRALAGRSTFANRQLAGRAAFADRRLAARGAGARFSALNRSGRLASAHTFGRRDWHNNWRRHRSAYFGWAGPVFWPYAYDDLFYDAFWGYGPYAAGGYYDDPFWAYGYGDIYGGLFSPYRYDDYAGWASGPTRLARGSSRTRTATARGGTPSDTTGALPPARWTQMCGDDTRDVVGLPIERIQEIVKPDDTQRAALDRLGDASVKAAQTIKAACPSDYSLTPTGRLAAMAQRLQALRQAVDVVKGPLDAFYNSLTDEQKARLNAAGQRERGRGEQRSFAQDCGSATGATEWPTERITRMVRPTEAQRDGLERLREASAKAADTLKSNCPTQTLATPPARLAAMAARLDVMIEAVRMVRTAADEFYGSLDDEQKAQFNTIGQARAAQ